DIRALDVIGWDFVAEEAAALPAPGSALLFAMGALVVVRRRR
ncbi:MAG: MYXO-CTERM domain-containing protein, partial [Alphaproteobacteria bacterium]